MTQPMDTPPKTTGRGRLAALAAAVALAALCAVFLVLKHPRDARGRAPMLVSVEAESAESLPPVMSMIDDPNASGGRAVRVADARDEALRAAAPLKLSAAAPRAGRYRLWVRAWWQDGCGNSIAVHVGDSPAMDVGNDGTYGVWHWVPGPFCTLKKGLVAIELLPREANARIDKVLLSSSAGFRPSGVSGTDAEPAAAPAPRQAEAPALPVLPAPAGAPKPPFRVAVGGAYRGGWESIWVGLGIPCERLREDEIADPKVLSRYQVVCLSGPMDCGDPVPALKAFIENGGVFIGEYLDSIPLWRRQNRGFLPRFRIEISDYSIRGKRTIHANGSPLFAGVPDGAEVYPRVSTTVLPPMPDTAGTELLGLIQHPKDAFPHYAATTLRNGHRVPSEAQELLAKGKSAAVLKKHLGKGTMYYMALPAGFISMWRGTRFDPLARALALEAVAGLYEPLYGAFTWNPAPLSKTNFADDFMRRTDQLGDWKSEAGTWSLTGDKPADKTLAFALRGESAGAAPGWIAAGESGWTSYRIAASMLTGDGEGGVWVTSSSNRQIALVLDAKRVRLVERASEGLHELASAALPGPGEGWRRIALLARDGRWLGYVDGERLVEAKAAGDTRGPAGLVVSRGRTVFDDVHVCDVAALLGGRDRRPGEEGSVRADPPSARGFEPRSIYAPQWYLRPDDSRARTVRVSLPTYKDAMLIVDGKREGLVKADPAGPLVALPALPRREIRLICPGWRDYVFGGRLVDWYTTGGDWKREPRWSCDPNWSWLGVKTDKPSVLWYRQPLTPPYCLNILACPVQEGDAYHPRRGREVNFVLGGNGRDLSSGVQIRVNPNGEPRSELCLGTRVLAASTQVHFPRGQNLHHRWFALKAVVEPRRVRFFYEGRQVFDQALDQPLATGRVGVWTQEGSIRVARATLSLSER